MKNTLRILTSLLLIIFGALSTFLTLSIIFDLFGIREKEGNYVPFIIYTNLVCGIIFIFAAFSNWKKLNMTTNLLGLASIVLVIAYISLLVYVDNGGVHEEKTLSAMLFRIGLTALLTLTSFYLNKKQQVKQIN